MVFPGVDITIAAYLVRNPDIFTRFEQDLEQYQFNNSFIKWVFVHLKQVWVDNARRSFPSLPEALYVIEEASKELPEQQRLYLTAACKQIYITEVSSVTANRVTRYLMKRRAEFLQDTLEDLDPADLERAENLLHELRVIRDSPFGVKSVLKSPFDKDAVEAQGEDDAEGESIPLGWYKTDGRLQGGMRRGETTLFQIPTNRGKTATMMALSRNWIMMGYRVLYVALDNPKSEMDLRYQECMMGAPRHTFESRKDFKDTFLLTYGNKEYWGAAADDPGKHLLMVTRKDFPRRPSCTEVQTILTQYEMSNVLKDYDRDRGLPPDRWGKVDVVVLDYARRMVPVFHNKQSRGFEKETAISEDIQEMAIVNNIAAVSATQENRGGHDKRDSGLSNVAGAFDQHFAAGLVGVHQQTEEEEKLGVFRLSWEKLRRGVEHFETTLEFDRAVTRVRECQDAPLVVKSMKPSKKKANRRKKAESHRDNVELMRMRKKAYKQGIDVAPALAQ